ncbi:MAG: 50S ribosomal protein L4 [Gammaproteobacteria bacterium]|nr:MAG: 50S ribosomal protein L4 [Gammaproteobacteria bacterium]
MIINEPKTRLMRDRLAELDAARCLVLLDEVTENIYLAARNLPNVQVLDVEGVDPVSLVRHPKIVATTAAIKKLEERLA